MSRKSINQSIEDVNAVLLYRGYISAYPAKTVCTGSASECARDLLFYFHHPNITFGQVIGKRNLKIIHECQDLVAVITHDSVRKGNGVPSRE